MWSPFKIVDPLKYKIGHVKPIHGYSELKKQGTWEWARICRVFTVLHWSISGFLPWRCRYSQPFNSGCLSLVSYVGVPPLWISPCFIQEQQPLTGHFLICHLMQTIWLTSAWHQHQKYAQLGQSPKCPLKTNTLSILIQSLWKAVLVNEMFRF